MGIDSAKKCVQIYSSFFTGMLHGTYHGIGHGLGRVVGGFLFSSVGAQTTFFIFGAFGFLVLTQYFLVNKTFKESEK